MSESLKEKTAKGLFWGALNSGSTQVLNLLFGIVLGRLLSPEEYGIVGVLGFFTAIAGDLQSAGFTQGLVNIKTPTDRDYNSVFSFNVCMSVTLYLALFFSAPLIAGYFNQECLVPVSRVVFLCFVISSLGIAHGGYMTKNMMNKEMAIIGALALLTSGVTGVVLAFLGFSYWALAWQQIAYMVVVNLGRYYYVRAWRPCLTLDFGPVKEMAPFAVKILVTKIINTTSSNILTVIFGRLFPIHQVGNYTQAFKWDTMAHSLIGNTVGQIAQPVLVEGGRLVVFRKMLRFTCFLSMPVMFGFALVSREFILITIGEGWLGCVPLLQVLCVSGAFMPLYTMYQNLAISHGRSDIFMWLNIGQIIFQVAVILAFYRFGMLQMVAAYSGLMILWLLPWHLCTGRLITYSWWDAFKDIAPFCFTAAVVMSSTYLLTTTIVQPHLLIVLRFVLAAVLYYIIMKIAKVQILKECEQFILNKIRR